MRTAQDTNVVSYLTLRQMIGWIGLLLPVVVRATAWYFDGVRSSDSISAYYYTASRDIFVSTMVLVGALLMCYRTEQLRDNVAAIACGIAAAGIGVFPMDPSWAPEIVANFPEAATEKCYANRHILGYHFVFVTTFFALSFYLVFFRFAAIKPLAPTRQKAIRNRIYRICGGIMLLAFATIGYLAVARRGASIFWPEAFAVVAFAAAWLVKGQTILKDPAPATTREAATEGAA